MRLTPLSLQWSMSVPQQQFTHPSSGLKLPLLIHLLAIVGLEDGYVRKCSVAKIDHHYNTCVVTEVSTTLTCYYNSIRIFRQSWQNRMRCCSLHDSWWSRSCTKWWLKFFQRCFNFSFRQSWYTSGMSHTRKIKCACGIRCIRGMCSTRGIWSACGRHCSHGT